MLTKDQVRECHIQWAHQARGISSGLFHATVVGEADATAVAKELTTNAIHFECWEWDGSWKFTVAEEDEGELLKALRDATGA